MEQNWTRPKVLEGVTKSIKTPAGTLHLTFNYDGGLVELIGHIGKEGSLFAKQIDITCRMLSIALQTPISRIKLIKKIKKNLLDIPMEDMSFEHEKETYQSVEDYIFKAVVKELEDKELQAELS